MTVVLRKSIIFRLNYGDYVTTAVYRNCTISVVLEACLCRISIISRLCGVRFWWQTTDL